MALPAPVLILIPILALVWQRQILFISRNIPFSIPLNKFSYFCALGRQNGRLIRVVAGWLGATQLLSSSLVSQPMPNEIPLSGPVPATTINYIQ